MSNMIQYPDGQWGMAPVKFKFEVYNLAGDQVGFIIAEMNTASVVKALKRVGLINSRHWNSSYELKIDTVYKLNEPFLKLKYILEGDKK